MDFSSSVPSMVDPAGPWWTLVPPSLLSELGYCLELTHMQDGMQDLDSNWGAGCDEGQTISWGEGREHRDHPQVLAGQHPGLLHHWAGLLDSLEGCS